jgi:hypothetical protein
MRRLAATTALALAALALAPIAEPARAPSLKQRESITNVLPAYVRAYPAGCVWLAVRISKDARYAIARPLYLNATRAPCSRYASSGYWLLKRTAGWRIVFNGSEPPPCSLGAPRDLIACAG